MKPLVKMTKIELLVFSIMAIFSGLTIGIGGAASQLAISLFENAGKLIGACLFSLGIFAIVTFEMRLFTGMVADIPTMGIKNTWKLLICFLGNTIGVVIMAGILYFSPIADKIIPVAQNLISAKLYVENWAIKVLCSAIPCGALITFSVWSVKYAPKKGLSPTVGVLFPIIVFAFCGFDHSVANMLYLCFLGEFSWRVLGYICLGILGNIIGGVLLPLAVLVRNYAQNIQQEKNEEKK